MDFRLSGEQQLLRQNLQEFLRHRHGFQAQRDALHSDSDRRPGFWKSLTDELGLLGAGLPERVGGSGGGAVEQLLIMEQFGYALVAEPYLETCVIAPCLLARLAGPRADGELRRIADGEAVFAYAWSEPGARYGFAQCHTTARREGGGWRLDGYKAVVIGAPWATQLLVTARAEGGDGVSLFLVDANHPGLAMHCFPTIDGRRAADLALQDLRLPATALLGEPGAALPALEEAGDRAIAAICAEALGVLRRMLEDTAAHLREREQFGQKLSTFQVLQHRMVDMYLQIEMAESATYRATLSLDAEPATRARAASTAKVTVAQACRYVGQNAVQLHGGMGMTQELALGSYFKRATAIEHEFGSVDYHLARHARLERAAA